MKTTTSANPAIKHVMPFVRLELVLFSVLEGSLHVLLSERQEAPFKGQWGLPGGVLRIDLDTSLEAGAQRVAAERLGRTLPSLNQVAAVGGALRDPRAPWAMSVIYRSLVRPDIETTPGKRVKALKWRKATEVITSDELAFDHSSLVAQALETTRREIRELRFPQGWMPEKFTLSELQAMSEVVLGEKLDKVTFRRRMELADIATALSGQMRTGGAHRPAQLYTLSPEPLPDVD